MEILATETLSNMSDGWAILTAMFGVIGFFGLGLFIIGVADDEWQVSLIGFAGLVVGIAVVVLLVVTKSYEYEQHTVKVTDINEIHEQGYEIVDTQGQLLIIQEIGADEQ